MSRISIKLRISHRPQQHRARSQTSLNRLGRQRVIHRRKCGPANQFVLKLNLMAKAASQGLQYKHRLIGNLRTNSIARKNSEI